jgi:hypothetical protein
MRTRFNTGRGISRVREIMSEIDYAQRRLLEIRTGIPMTQRSHRHEIAALESVWSRNGDQ